jgi:phosphoserine phosphatase
MVCELPARFTHALNIISEDARFLAEELHGIEGKFEWLSDGYAFDIQISSDPVAALAEARHAAGGRSADVNVVPIANRRKKLLVADMDSTIIACECIDELADQVGIKPEVAAITERAMRGEIDFPSALRERVALLKGLPLDALAKVYAERVRLNPGARRLTATMRLHGAHTLLVSGGFTYFTSRVAAAAGFENHQANRLVDDGRVLTGTVAEPILGREAKLEALRSTAIRLGITPRDAFAVGDGANDLDMIKEAGLGVAYHAKPIVAAAAAARIAHGDLAALLYLQGYSDNEIVGG